MIKRIIACILFIFSFASVYSQKLQYSVEMSGAASDGGYSPFWHVSNRQGLGSIDTRSGYVRAALVGNTNMGQCSLGYGADIVVAGNHTSRIFVQQAFADIGWRMFTLSLGQKERWSNFKNPLLTTGGLTESGNARPVPQIRLEVPRYWDIFGTNGWFTLRGHLAYGWFTDEDWQKEFAADSTVRTVGVRYHSKAIFFKIGKEARFPLTLEFGLEMVSQFGGTCYNSNNKPGNNHHNPSRPKDYLMALFPTSGDSEYDGSDQANIAGNMLGSWHGALTWDAGRWALRGYYEHVFEDHSQMFWEYGLWTEQLVGVELTLEKGRWVNGIVLEYFNLKNQSGPIYHDSSDRIPDQISCADDNYNHQRYPGWFNYGMMMGTPLCSSPIYNKDGKLICYNNRVEAFHLGISGAPFRDFGYRVLLTKSNNWGTYKHPFTDIKENMSGLLEVRYSPARFKGWSATASFAFDSGDLYGDNNGCMLTISKCGVLNF